MMINHVDYVSQCLFVKSFKRLLTLNFVNVNNRIFYAQSGKFTTIKKAVA